MELCGNEEGIFLVRCTQRNENILVLSMMWNSEFFNYEICIKEEPHEKLFYIDDGPYFRKLPHLIDHYSKYEDGLPCALKRPIEPGFSSQSLIGHPNLNSTQINRPLKQTASNSSSSSIRSDLTSSSNGNQFINGNGMLIQHPFTRLDSFDQMPDQHLMQNGQNNMAKVNLFKSRTLLNDQSITYSIYTKFNSLYQTYAPEKPKGLGLGLGILQISCKFRIR